MWQAILLAVARYSKFQIRIRHFRRSANRTAMQCLGFNVTYLETTPPLCDFAAVTRVPDDGRTEENQIICHRANGCGAKLHGTNNDLHEQDRGGKPGDPFH